MAIPSKTVTPKTAVDRATLETLVRHLSDDPETGSAANATIESPSADAETPLPRRARGR